MFADFRNDDERDRKETNEGCQEAAANSRPISFLSIIATDPFPDSTRLVCS